MKIFLATFFLVLVPLAFAEMNPYAKLLFHDGYVLTESNDPRGIEYFYQKNWDGGYFVFKTTDNDTEGYAMMFLKRGLVKKSEGFVIESRPSGYLLDSSKCWKEAKANEIFKGMLVSCREDISIRELTEKERGQIEQYKREQKASKKLFEVVYGEEHTITKSTEMDLFSYGDVVGEKGYHNLLIKTRINPDEKEHEVYLVGKRAISLTIESLPSESKEKCGKPALDDLFLVYCQGNIRVRV